MVDHNSKIVIDFLTDFDRVTEMCAKDNKIKFEVEKSTSLFVITNFLPHKPIERIYASSNLENIENFLIGYFAAKKIYENLGNS